VGKRSSPSPVGPLVERLESLATLDEPAKAVGKAVRDAVGPGAVKDALSGTWLGHALHPLLTDVTITAFVGASMLDVLGGDDDGRATERLIAIGLASGVPTVATGLNDWADTEIADERVRRVGAVHAAANTTAFTLYASSLAARRAGNPGRGKALGLAGVTALTVGGYLGAHMSFFQGVGPNQTVFDQAPGDWSAVAAAGDLQDGTPLAVVAGDAPVLLLRHGDGLHALHDRCSHRGCPLSGGEIDGEVITCPCHGSRFDLRDGSVQRGPATAPQPVYDVRENDGQIEVRLPESG
jgi:nitrite reductase/ring-hydroxylating ferredoxin subunit